MDMVRSIETRPMRVIVARMEPGEDILDTIEKVVETKGIRSGTINLIGATSRVQLGYFDRRANEYKSFLLNEDLEVVSCMGNISRLEDGSPVIHAHMIVSSETGNCYGGHLMKGCEVSVTIEMIIQEMDIDMTRATDSHTGLNLLDL
ncbi:MAG: DNA-binding protein [Candidatus Thorarchaeota archaeon]|nr:DNA-binding protein [Candidatus Thorarchaeota archaeon]